MRGWTPGDLCDLNGMSVPLSYDRREARRRRDRRPSLEQLYGEHRGYVRAVRADTSRLVRERLLLPEDAREAVAEARRGDVLVPGT